jgi:hypothetical protein
MPSVPARVANLMPKGGYAPLTGSTVLDELVAIIGWDGMLAVSRAFGGQQLDIPLDCSENHKIVRAVGRNIADKLSAYRGNTTLEIPIAFRREAEIRHLASLRPKLTINEIADRTLSHRRTVLKTLAQPPRAITVDARKRYQPPPLQMNLPLSEER